MKYALKVIAIVLAIGALAQTFTAALAGGEKDKSPKEKNHSREPGV